MAGWSKGLYLLHDLHACRWGYPTSSRSTAAMWAGPTAAAWQTRPSVSPPQTCELQPMIACASQLREHVQNYLKCKDCEIHEVPKVYKSKKFSSESEEVGGCLVGKTFGRIKSGNFWDLNIASSLARMSFRLRSASLEVLWYLAMQMGPDSIWECEQAR